MKLLNLATLIAFTLALAWTIAGLPGARFAWAAFALLAVLLCVAVGRQMPALPENPHYPKGAPPDRRHSDPPSPRELLINLAPGYRRSSPAGAVLTGPQIEVSGNLYEPAPRVPEPTGPGDPGDETET